MITHSLPPRPEVVRVERLSAPRTDELKNIYKIYAGTKERQLTILLDVTTPKGAALFRPGPHRHSHPDIMEFISFMRAKMDGKATPEHLLTDPYPEIDVESYLF